MPPASGGRAWESGIRPAQELRALDWVDYLLYLAAAAGFVWPTFSLLSSGEVPAYLVADREAGLIPNFVGEAEQRSYQYTAFLFGLFVVLVYVRNYVIMHRIDSHKEARHYEFFFVSYNTHFWSWAERWVRALIVLWVLATTIGAFPPVTSAIHYVIREFVAHTAGLPTYQNISIIQGFFAYFYGFVILVLFILFLLWDMINLASISRQIKKGAFSNKCLGPPAAFSATARAETLIRLFRKIWLKPVPSIRWSLTYVPEQGHLRQVTQTRNRSNSIAGRAFVLVSRVALS